MNPMNKALLPSRIPGGAYILHLKTERDLMLRTGSLGNIALPSGHYVYIGSARKSISGRVNRHKRLAETKRGKRHWHIDYMLAHPEVKLIRGDAYAGYRECDIAKQIETMKGVSTPVLRFGSSDCRSGCKAHLFRMGGSLRNKIPSIVIRKEKRKNSKT